MSSFLRNFLSGNSQTITSQYSWTCSHSQPNWLTLDTHSIDIIIWNIFFNHHHFFSLSTFPTHFLTFPESVSANAPSLSSSPPFSPSSPSTSSHSPSLRPPFSPNQSLPFAFRLVDLFALQNQFVLQVQLHSRSHSINSRHWRNRQSLWMESLQVPLNPQVNYEDQPSHASVVLDFRQGWRIMTSSTNLRNSIE